MVDFVIVGGKAKKAKARFGGESGRNYDRSFERRHLKLTSKQLVAAALEDLLTYERTSSAPVRASAPVVVEIISRPRATSLTFPRAVCHNNRKVVSYPGGLRIQSASY